MKKFTYWLWLMLIGILNLQADEQETHDSSFSKEGPWFTGPLLAPSGKTVKPGSFRSDIYVKQNISTGRYDNHKKAFSTPNFYQTALQAQIKVGLLKGLDFQFYPQIRLNATQGEQDFNVGDIPLGLNIQLLSSERKDPWPNIKLSAKANAPLGKYKHLNVDKKRTDAMGVGSWLPATTLTFTKLMHTKGIHYLETRLSINYQIGTAVLVKGFNTYGGAADTKGFVYPGNVLSVDAAFEYNLTQRWAFACDLYYAYGNKRRFSGTSGTDSTGAPVKMTRPVNERWTLAPAIEYNFSKNIGLISGVWFSFAGKNTDRFANAIIALNIYI